MEGLATATEVNDLKKSVHDLVELAKKKDAEFGEVIKNTVSEVLKNHPGFTPERKIQFEETNIALTPERRAERIINKMPVELRRQLDDIYLMSKMLGRKPNQLKAWQDFKDEGKDYVKALSAVTAGGVDEWVPTDFTSELYQFVRLQTVVSRLFRTVTMPSNPYTFPIQVGRLASYKHTEQTSDSPTKMGLADAGGGWSSNFTLTAEGHGTRLLMSKDAEEDSIVPLVSQAQSEIVTVFAEGREDVILNGDIVTGTHQDLDVTAATDRRKIATGIRKLANSASYTRDMATFNLSNLRLMRGDLRKYGVRPSNLAFITGIRGWLKFIDLPEVTTVDKYGPGATILSGELAKVDGIPIIVSEWIREDLNSAGIYPAAGQSKTVTHLVNRDGFIIGERRNASVQLLKELYAESDQDALVCRERFAFRETYPLATNPTIRNGLNF